MARNTIAFALFAVFICLNGAVGQTFTRINTGAIPKDPGNNQGSAWGDYDNDGFVDLFITHSSGFGMNQPNLLYHNEGNGTLKKVTTGIIPNDTIPVSGAGASWGDYDNDGRLDLYTSTAAGPSRLYHNDGGGNFTEYVPRIFSGGSDGCWADLDNDGRLDLIISTVGYTNALYRNNANGTFTQIDTGIVARDTLTGMSPSWGDFNNDGYPDLFWATAFFDGTERNKLYLNHGNGFFTGAGSIPIIVSDSDWTTGASWGDYDNDGYLDLYVTNFNPPSAVNHLYHNNKDGTFTQLLIDPPEASGACTVSSVWGDFDNDGYIDLLVTNDRFFPTTAYVPPRDNFLYHNNGDGSFTRITTGDIVKDGGHSPSACDFDNDGFLDIVIVNGSLGLPNINYLYHNDGNSNHWVNIRCVGTTSNRSAIGTRVRAKATIGGKAIWQMREIAQMSGCHENSDLRVHFGLGNASAMDSLVIRWPSGQVDTYTGVALDNFYAATESQGMVPVYISNILPAHSQTAKHFALKGVDSLLFTTRFSNIYHHQFTAHAICSDTNGVLIDSVALFDDGLHGDSASGDGIYSGYIPPRKDENYFSMGVSTFDPQTSKYVNTPDVVAFTSVGPITIAGYTIATSDTTAGPGKNLRYRLTLKNDGTASTVKNVTAKIIALDTAIALVNPLLTYGDIVAGQTFTSATLLGVRYPTSHPGPYEAKFSVEISTGGMLCWKGTFSDMVVGVDEATTKLPLAYALEQNYPNPFNPLTIIKYTVGVAGGQWQVAGESGTGSQGPGAREAGAGNRGLGARKTMLVVYDVLGRQVATLVNEKKAPGSYEVSFDASRLASGVYFYTLTAGSFSQTRAMMLLK